MQALFPIQPGSLQQGLGIPLARLSRGVPAWGIKIRERASEIQAQPKLNVARAARRGRLQKQWIDLGAVTLEAGGRIQG